jgi:peptidoglycan/LPS O-acetylase OafA/YrhL
MENRSIPGLDLIRFAAALMVAWFHLAFWSWFQPDGPVAKIAGGAVYLPNLAPAAWWGWVGVEIFFVISGFVITMSAQGRSAGSFLKGRVLRLYPAVWICAPITTAILLLVGSDADLPVRLATSITLFPVGAWVDGVYWTLGIEMTFYGLVWLLLASFGQQYLPWLLAAIAAPSIAIWSGRAVGIEPHYLLLSRYAELVLLPHGVFFALGGLICLRATIGPILKAVAALSLIAGCVAIYALTAGYKTGFNPMIPVIVWLIAVGGIWASDRWNEAIGAVLHVHAPAIRKIGTATYPLYLLHDVPGAAIMRWTASLSDGLSLALALLITSAASFLVAGYCEQPVRRFLDNLIGRFEKCVVSENKGEQFPVG